MTSKAAERAKQEFVESILRESWAIVPKWKVLRWYEQERFTKGIVQDLKERAANDEDEDYYDVAGEIEIYATAIHVMGVRSDTARTDD